MFLVCDCLYDGVISALYKENERRDVPAAKVAAEKKHHLFLMA
mgnify:CR=1